MIELRRITAIPTLMHWRAEVLESVFGEKPDRRLLVANRRYFREHVPSGSHIAFVAAVDGDDAGCGAICLYDEMPSPDNRTGRCAYLMNIYVRPAFRHRGVGHAIVGRLVEEARLRDCGKIYLETTGAARSLYTGEGFRAMPDMMKHYDT